MRLSDYNAKLTELDTTYKGCASLFAARACINATNEKIALAKEIDPLLKNMPTSENVTNALRATQEIITAGDEWAGKNCASLVEKYSAFIAADCTGPVITVETYFHGLTTAVADITR